LGRSRLAQALSVEEHGKRTAELKARQKAGRTPEENEALKACLDTGIILKVGSPRLGWTRLFRFGVCWLRVVFGSARFGFAQRKHSQPAR